MHDFVHWHCSTDYWVQLLLDNENLRENCFNLHQNDFCLIPLGECASWRRATNRCKNLKFWHFWERPLYKTGSMPLMHHVNSTSTKIFPLFDYHSISLHQYYHVSYPQKGFWVTFSGFFLHRYMVLKLNVPYQYPISNKVSHFLTTNHHQCYQRTSTLLKTYCTMSILPQPKYITYWLP